MVDDGRRIGFAEFGSPQGRAVFWLHGTPGARRQIPEPARVAAIKRDIRLIGIDRPGVGFSTPHLYHQVLDFASDLRNVADVLGIDDFGLIGLSGGGPYVLAAAYDMPARFQSVLSPLREPLAFLVSTFVRVARPVGSPALDLYARLSPAGDRRLLGRPEFKAMFLDDLLNGSRAGLRAPIYDAVLFGRDWGFSVRDVKVPIKWWHGDADHIIPLRHGEHVVSLLPDADLHIQPGESHLGGLGEAEAVLDALLAAWDSNVVAFT
jgi:pimeloyl-ACP methyl ester carboxylesterase